jgi:DNA adenine methylase
VGGKRRLAVRIHSYFPENVAELTYVEPFLGAGALFFLHNPRNAFISDKNRHLIQFYRQIRDDAPTVYSHLQALSRRLSVLSYYRVRQLYNESKWSPQQAARFLFLNLTCFNGIFRVNRKNQFNVPFGRRTRVHFPTSASLQEAARTLRQASIHSQCFRRTMPEVSKKSFVYLDPPYPPATSTAFFTHYTADRFGDQDQVDLAEQVRKLDRRGVRFLLSNSDTETVRTLYKGFQIREVGATRFVSCKARVRAAELLIFNYDAPESSIGTVLT